jgi:DNA polymerase III subunit delta'
VTLPLQSVLPWQTELLQSLLTRHAENKLPHALLVHGMKGVGKVQFAQTLAKSLLCEDQQSTGLACGKCVACGWFAANNHPDYREIAPASELDDDAETSVDADTAVAEKVEKKSTQIAVDQIRALSDFMTLTSHRNGFRVLVLYPAEAMNIAAANALLKTLEEPPARTAIILVTHQLGRLVATITSRCQQVLIAKPTAAAAQAWLAAQGLDNPELLLAQVGGAPLAALEIADADLQKVRREFLAVLGDLNADHLAAAAKWEKLEKPELARLFGYLHTWVCDLIVVRATGAAQFHPDQLRGLEAIGKHANLPRLFRYESELRQQRRSIMHPLNARLLLEQLLLSYRQAVQ